MKNMYRIILQLLLFFYFSFILLVQIYDLKYVESTCIKHLKEKYALPFFEQNWSMFSPNPPKGNHYFLVKYYTATWESDFIDIQQIIRTRSFSTFFSIDQRLKKYFSDCFNDIIHLQNSKVNITSPHKSQGLESIVNYAKIVFKNQKEFSKQLHPKDSVFVQLYLVDDQLNEDIHQAKTYTTYYSELNKLFLLIND
ncbi:hypothetical protein HX004_12840 [Myroides sp. 1354]|uniref:DUF5819 family protein n=1 Tax=unclassified Myroides TaxID=2642485 RepID=UPI002576C9C2|nr:MULTISPECIES: DUF5819 family protein [unclassified Myroides]MDM1045656.1 hypothetical protein [Myroides sp. R163-1]MDM1056658.1 hypothetical protein [Myroides sp. 1354]MDM1069786.1 hypothetical protein [Myroides sp. 1372]